MPLTRTNLANRVLNKLMVVGSGQSPNAEDTQKVDDSIDSFADFLSAADIYTISDLADIDSAAFEWLADYLAFIMAPDFGVPQDDTKRDRADFMLKLITSTRPTYQVAAAEHF
jgi:hypothetical protein